MCILRLQRRSPARIQDRAAAALGRVMLEKNLDLVYGGASVGLMGEVADTILNGGGRVTGVIPKPLVNREISHQGLTRLVAVDSMHERKSMMAELSDGFIAASRRHRHHGRTV